MNKIFIMIILICNLTILAFASNDDTPLQMDIIGNLSNQQSIVLFEQNFSEIKTVPSNILLINLSSKNPIYNFLRGNYIYILKYNNKSKSMEYIAERKKIIMIIDSHPFSDLANSFDWMNSSLFLRFLHIISNPCYVSGFTPMTRCTYKITLGLETDNPKNFVEINSPGARIRYQILGNRTVKLTSSYFGPNEICIYKSLFISEKNRTTFYIKYDGVNKTNTILYNDSYYIETPFYDYQRRSLPYPDISNNWIKFTHYLPISGKYSKLYIYEISQISQRKLITPIGYARAIPFGLDGPHPFNTIQKGIELLNENRYSGTIWIDIGYINSYNKFQIEYLRDLVNNKSWEIGIHFSKELNKLTLKDAHALMKDEYNIIENKIGFKPKTWCSLRNNDNISHAIIAYNELGMIWRNGESGIHAESLGGIGNLDDYTWCWWKSFSMSGFVTPVFTHQTDEQPAIDYSISYDNFTKWVENYKINNITIMPFGKWWKINSNTCESYFSNITLMGNVLTFGSKTNGYDSLINVNVKPMKTTKIYDKTAHKVVSWKNFNNDSIFFWIENGHDYEVSNISSQTSKIETY